MAYTPFISIPRPATIGAFVGGKTVIERLPFTPFWVVPAGGDQRGIELNGADFLIRQNHFSYPNIETQNDWDGFDPGERNVVCGSKTYRRADGLREWVKTYDYEAPEGEEPTHQEHDGSSGQHPPTTWERTTVVDFSAVPFIISDGSRLPGSLERSASEKLSHNFHYGFALPVEDPPVLVDYCKEKTSETLSEEVTKTWLDSQMVIWKALPDSTKESLYGSFNGYMSYASGATEGWKLKIAFFEYEPEGYWFSGTNFGMTGDRGDYWNGDFSTHIIKQTRMNFPSLWLEATKRISDGFIFAPTRGTEATGFPTTGESIYKAGYYEEELSDEVTGDVVDDFGVFNFGDADNWDVALEGCPWRRINLAGVPMANGSLLTSRSRGEAEGEANELMVLSATGRRYRVEIQVGNFVDGEWSTDTTAVMETDAATLRANERFPGSYGKSIRISAVDVWEKEEWLRVADIADWDGWKSEEEAYWTAYYEWEAAWFDWLYGGEAGPEPEEPEYDVGAEPNTPGHLIGTSPLQGKPLWSVAKWRRGSEFGFSPLNFSGSGRRWLKKTYRKHRTVGAFDTSGMTGCGSASISGNFDLEYEEEFVDGELREKKLLQWNAVIGGEEWTPEDWTQFIHMPSFGDIYTETLQRHYLDDESTDMSWFQYASVSFDKADDNGKLISEATEEVAMSIDGSTNKGPWTDVDTPAAGRNVYVPGHRLTYTPPG